MADVVAALDTVVARFTGKHAGKISADADKVPGLFFAVLASRIGAEQSGETVGMPSTEAVDGKIESAEAAGRKAAKQIPDAIDALASDQSGQAQIAVTGAQASIPATRETHAGGQPGQSGIAAISAQAPIAVGSSFGSSVGSSSAVSASPQDELSDLPLAEPGQAPAEPKGSPVTRAAIPTKGNPSPGEDAGSATARPAQAGLVNAGAATANPAGEGQSLPLAPGQQLLGGQRPAQPAADYSALSPSAPEAMDTTAAPGQPTQASSTAASPLDSLSVRPFEQALRHADAKVNVSVDAPIRSSAFSAEFGEKIAWLAGRQGQWASLSLNPPQLGTVEVRLSVSGGEVGAQFFSPHAAVRDVIEAALPKLKELMAGVGLSLGESQVRQEAFTQRDGSGSPMGKHPGNPALPDAVTGSASLGMTRHVGLGLVDLYV